MILEKIFVPLGQFCYFSGEVGRAIFSRQFARRTLLRQLDRVGVESLTVINLCAFFISLVLVIQIAALLAKFGARQEVGSVIGLSFVREIGPVFTAIMFTGRIGTGVTAELASMLATEQLEALRVMGSNPMTVLVAPRVLAMLIMLPALTAIANVVGIFSGYLGALIAEPMSPLVFARKAVEKLVFLDVVASLSKALIFGLIIGLIATYSGIRSEGTTEAVGKATTRTMVAGVLAVLFADFILTKLFLGLTG